MLGAIPFLLRPGDPVPPIAVVNEILGGSDGHGGMSGGVEWPRHQLTEREYQGVRRQLIEGSALIDIDAPGRVRSREEFRTWTVMAKSGCSRGAAQAWLLAIMETGGGDEQRVLHEQRDGWLRTFDER